MKRLVVLWTCCSLFLCAPVFGVRALVAAPVAMVTEVPAATVDRLLRQFVDLVPYGLEDLYGFYASGRLTLSSAGDDLWSVALVDDDGGTLIAILEDKF